MQSSSYQGLCHKVLFWLLLTLLLLLLSDGIVVGRIVSGESVVGLGFVLALLLLGADSTLGVSC